MYSIIIFILFIHFNFLLFICLLLSLSLLLLLQFLFLFLSNRKLLELFRLQNVHIGPLLNDGMRQLGMLFSLSFSFNRIDQFHDFYQLLLFSFDFFLNHILFLSCMRRTILGSRRGSQGALSRGIDTLEKNHHQQRGSRRFHTTTSRLCQA